MDRLVKVTRILLLLSFTCQANIILLGYRAVCSLRKKYKVVWKSVVLVFLFLFFIVVVQE